MRILRLFVLVLTTFSFACWAHADVSLTDQRSWKRALNQYGKTDPKKSKAGTGARQLIDGSDLEWFINTDITFATSSSASGAVSEASYTHAVSATTLGGGVVAATLSDAFDGYNALLVGVDGSCTTWDNACAFNDNGAASVEDGGREVVFNTQNFGGVQVYRKVFVPADDEFSRWLNFFTNNDSVPHTVIMRTSNNLGSDSATILTGTSDGDMTVEVTDTWFATMQNYGGTTSPDVRLAHVMQDECGPVRVSAISYANGDDNPWWQYTFTLQPGETKIIMNFATGQPSKADTWPKAEDLAQLRGHALDGMSAEELKNVANFCVAADLTVTKTDSPDPVRRTEALTYQITVKNSGPSDANNVVLTDNLPNTVLLTSVNPSQGTYTVAGSIVTCQLGTLAVGATATVTIVVHPQVTGWISDTASVTSDNTDPNPNDNTVTQDTDVIALPPDLSTERRWTTQLYRNDTAVTANFRVHNYGETAAGPFDMIVYLSRDSTLDRHDKVLLTKHYKWMAPQGHSKPIKIKYEGTKSILRWYFIAIVDPGNTVAEGNENNNIDVRKIIHGQ